MEYLGYFAAVLMGVSLGLIGGGGSILTVPILVYLFSQDPLVATTGSLFVVGSTALVGALVSARRKLIDFKTGILFSIPSFAGVFVARHLILPNLPEVIYAQHGLSVSKAGLVLGSFAILMVLASRVMIRSSGAPVLVIEKKSSLLSLGLNGFLVGVTTGFVGAGGGFLIIPALVILLKLPMKMAVGTSLAIIAANSFFGFTISMGEHHLDWPVLLTVAAIGALGILIGQKFSSKINEKSLKKGFGYFVLIIGSFVLIDQLLKLH